MLEARDRASMAWSEAVIRMVRRHSLALHSSDGEHLDIPDPAWMEIPVEPDGAPWLDVVKR